MMTHFQQRIICLLALSFFTILQTTAYADAPPCPPGGKPGDPNSAPVGKVVWIKGASFKATRGEGNTRELKDSSIIFLKDTLITGGNTQAEIVFTDHTLMTFREGSTFFINDYSYDPSIKKGSAGKYIMNLIEGGFRTITGLIAKQNPSDYQMNTPVATIGVRGTEYAVYFNQGKMAIGYYEGSPCVTTKKKKATLCLSENDPYATVDGPDAIPVPVSIRPDTLGPTLQIVPAKIEPFIPANGVINSFCIT